MMAKLVAAGCALAGASKEPSACCCLASQARARSIDCSTWFQACGVNALARDSLSTLDGAAVGSAGIAPTTLANSSAVTNPRFHGVIVHRACLRERVHALIALFPDRTRCFRDDLEIAIDRRAILLGRRVVTALQQILLES